MVNNTQFGSYGIGEFGSAYFGWEMPKNISLSIPKGFLLNTKLKGIVLNTTLTGKLIR